MQSHAHKGKKAARNVPQQLVIPGAESYRRLLEESARYVQLIPSVMVAKIRTLYAITGKMKE